MSAGSRRATSAMVGAKQTMTSNGALPADTALAATPGGSAPSVRAKSAGARTNPSRAPGFSPSFWGRGVPE